MDTLVICNKKHYVNSNGKQPVAGLVQASEQSILLYLLAEETPSAYDRVVAFDLNGNDFIECSVWDLGENLSVTPDKILQMFDGTHVVNAGFNPIRLVSKSNFSDALFGVFEVPRSVEQCIAVIENGVPTNKKYRILYVCINETLYFCLEDVSQKEEKPATRRVDAVEKPAAATQYIGISSKDIKKDASENPAKEPLPKPLPTHASVPVSKQTTDVSANPESAVSISGNKAAEEGFAAKYAAPVGSEIDKNPTQKEEMQENNGKNNDIRRPSLVFSDDSEPNSKFNLKNSAAKTSIKIATKKPVAIAPLLTPEIKKKNLRSACGITYKTLVLLLSENKEIVAIDKETGAVTRTAMKDIFDNAMIGMSHEIEIIKALDNAILISSHVDVIAPVDLRHMIESLEDRKNNAVSGVLYTLETKSGRTVLYVSSPHFEEKKTIRDGVIALHAASSMKYEKLKTDLKSFSSSVHLVLSNSGAAVVIGESIDNVKTIDVKDIYKSDEDLIDIWSIMSLFPADCIVSGQIIGIDDSKEISKIAEPPVQLPEKALAFHPSRRVAFAYETESRALLKFNKI